MEIHNIKLRKTPNHEQFKQIHDYDHKLGPVYIHPNWCTFNVQHNWNDRLKTRYKPIIPISTRHKLWLKLKPFEKTLNTCLTYTPPPPKKNPKLKHLFWPAIWKYQKSDQLISRMIYLPLYVDEMLLTSVMPTVPPPHAELAATASPQPVTVSRSIVPLNQLSRSQVDDVFFQVLVLPAKL